MYVYTYVCTFMYIYGKRWVWDDPSLWMHVNLCIYESMYVLCIYESMYVCTFMWISMGRDGSGTF